MKSERQPKSRLPAARDRAATELRILDATAGLLAHGGFAALGIKAIADAAGVDKVLIYRYFGRLDDLLAAFGEHASFWPPVEEVVAPDNDTLPPAERLTAFFDRLITALGARPLTIQILAMEVAAPNPLTATLDHVREEWGRAVAARLGHGLDLPSDPALLPLNTVVSLLVAGIQYLLIRARHTPVFSGMAIDDERGWSIVRAHLAWLATTMLPASPAVAPSAPGRRLHAPSRQEIR